MRIERIRIEGFGPLSGVDLVWPEGELLLVIDPNESGKTTLCEAIVAGLYGLPRGKAGVARARELRRPRNGARLGIGLDLVADGVRWSVDRDLEAGTLRVVDRDQGTDRTREFLRGGGRDLFGESVTGLTEPLFRTTAYVGQNVLDRDELDSTLTVELAKIADSGGGEASVVRALRALLDVRSKMPEPTTGPSPSVETEVLRLTKRIEERRAEGSRLGEAREAAAEASALLARLTAERDRRRRAADLSELAVVETERLALGRRVGELRRAAAARQELEREAEGLAGDAVLYAPEGVAEIERLLAERGSRPEARGKARAALEEERRALEQDARDRVRRFGPAARLPDEARARLVGLLQAVIDSAEESATATEALEAQWEALRHEGLAEDLQRLDAIAGDDREFLLGAEETRSALELGGVHCDRRAADASAAASIAAGERRDRVGRARGLVVGALLLLPLAVWLGLAAPRVPPPLAIAVAAFTAGLGLFGSVAWVRAARHRREDEAAKRDEEAACRQEARELRQKLGALRLRLDRVARGAGFGDATRLMRANRRARLAEEKRRALVDRSARKAAAAERRSALEKELEPYREAISCPAGLPDPEDARRATALLGDLERSVRAAEARAAALAGEAERIAREEVDLVRLDAALRDALERCGIPRLLSFSEALLVLDSGRRRAARRREIVDVELPARAEGTATGEEEGLAPRLEALEAEVSRRFEALGADREEIRPAETPEEARRGAEEAREAVRKAEEARLAAERTLAERTRDGGERARAVQESLADSEAALARATLFRDAVDLAREALSAAASEAYGDFRQGLSEASRAILARWDVPYERLEFADDLSVSVVVRGGRVATKAEIASAVSTGAREQLHLTARLAALRYLGTEAAGVPLLLDDPLVTADDARFVSVMRFLAGQVLLERPVLLVSCHLWRHERLLDALPDWLRERISVLSLAALRSDPAPPSPRQARLPIDGDTSSD